MNTTVNNNNIESNNGMSQVINILTGETKKMRCHYIGKRNDKPVSRVLTLERLSHPALTAAGVTAWAERFNDGVNRFDWLRVSIQLTDKICYTPNCANVGLPDVENYGNLDYYKNLEGAMRVYMNNVDKFFQSIADKPAKMMTGEDWPNMAVIAAYKAAGRDKEADTLTAARDIYNARREAKNETWSKKYAAQQYYYNSPKPKNFDELTELERAQFMMQTAQECAKDHPELDWADILEKAEKRLEKAEKEEEKAIREAEKAAKEREDATLEPTSEITDAPIVKREPFGKMFIYRLYIKWKWMQQRFERIGDMDRAADCFYHRLRLTKLYIYQPGWRIMDYGDMKPIFFPRQRIK